MEGLAQVEAVGLTKVENWDSGLGWAQESFYTSGAPVLNLGEQAGLALKAWGEERSK